VPAASRSALLPPPLEVGKHFPLFEPPPPDLARDNPAQHREDFALEFQWQGGSGVGEEYPGQPAPPPNAEGADRARSATEAFLYRRLETLTETAGKFHLNAELPIAFDGWGRMEVDLLCERPRLAIELDGSQHLGDPDAYRRDRRKDALLQENGYRVLRFLAEDVGKYLDQVLDAILRALSRQGARI